MNLPVPRPANLRFSRRVVWVTVTLTVAALLALGGVGITTASWADTMRDEGRLLPGTAIAGVDVGGATVDEAAERVEDALASRLEQPITITAADRTWTTSPVELGATTDLDAVLEDAFERTEQAGLPALAWLRLAGSGSDVHDVSVTVDESAVQALVDAIADAVDRPASSAELAWDDDGFALTEAVVGRSVQQSDAVAALVDAVTNGSSTVALPVVEEQPGVDTDRAQAVSEALTPRVDAALDHEVTAVWGDETWTTTPRELGASPDVASLVRRGLASGADAVADAAVDVTIPQDALDGFVGTMAEAVYVPSQDAEASWDGSRLHVTDHQVGRALDRDDATERLGAALAGATAEVELSTVSLQPTLTRSSFDRFLLLDQGERRLHLFEGGTSRREWPVAVGTSGTPTPTGTFTVGLKRYEPTWVNPSPGGWGNEMPARIGPGPDNPLGLRALNWYRGGADTLIRFHGTPNEDSIGQAASHGCVRMFNEDVIELYDLVPTGTPIVSTH